MPREVLLTADAERDLDEMVEHIARADSPRASAHVLDRLSALTATLAANPERGAVPRELQPLGIRDYRQVFFKPYRVIYRVVDDRVIVYLIADGRRDLQSLLARRLLRA